MDIKNISGIFSDSTPDKIHWGGAYGLWDICRHKVIGIPVLDLLYDHVQDAELKKLIENGIDAVAIPHIEKIQNTMKASGQTYPAPPQRKNIDDQQIARAIAEILRLALSHDIQGFMGVTREDLRSLVWEILNDDKKAFDKIMEMSRKKGWLFNPPNVIS